MTEKKNSLFSLLTRAVQSIKKTSGYFIVSRLISSEAKEIISTSFLSLLNVSSLHRSEISDWTAASVFNILVVLGRPRGLEIAQTYHTLSDKIFCFCSTLDT